MSKRIAVLALAGTIALAVPALANFQANLGPSHSQFGVDGGGGSFGISLKGTVPSGLLFGASLGETWSTQALNDTSDAYGRTFCIEPVVLVSKTWFYASVDDDVKNGPTAPPYSLLVLQDATKRVFSNYVLNTSAFQTIAGDVAYSSLNWGSYTGSWNKVMQALFWDVQQVNGSTGSKFFNQLSAGAEQNAYNALLAIAASGHESQVKVLNLWQNANLTGDRQSQLALVVPVPGAAVLALLGLAGIGWVKRRGLR